MAKHFKFKMKDTDEQRILDAFNGLYPAPTDHEGNPLFTPDEWPCERLRLFILEVVLRWEQHVAKEAAGAEVAVPDDLIETEA